MTAKLKENKELHSATRLGDINRIIKIMEMWLVEKTFSSFYNVFKFEATKKYVSDTLLSEIQNVSDHFRSFPRLHIALIHSVFKWIMVSPSISQGMFQLQMDPQLRLSSRDS